MGWEQARTALDMLAGKWTLPILSQLNDRPMRVGELVEALGGPSTKVIHESLGQLEERDVVRRTVLPSSPPGVQYRLTGTGRILVAILDEIEAGLIDAIPPPAGQPDHGNPVTKK